MELLDGDINESRPRRFPDPLPPPHGDADLLAAGKREELIWALHKERIRRDMILRQLGKIERAIAMAASVRHHGHWPLQALPPSQEDYWHHRRPPSLPPSPWDETVPRPPPAETDHPPGFPFPWSSAAVRQPPVYPHVERSPSPPPADDGDQQQKCSSPGAAVRPMLSGDLEGCRSPSKRTLPEGAALVPWLSASNTNVGAGMMLSASFTEEVTPGDRLAIVGGEPKHDVDEGHGVQPLYGSGDQSGEQRETVESTVNNQSDELVVRPCQYGSASVKNRASHEQIIAFRECIAATCRTSGAMTLPEGVLVAAAASAGAPMMMSALVAEEVTPGDRWAAGREEHKHGVEDGLDVQPLHGSGNQCTEQMKTVESTMKYQSDKLLARPCQYRPASEENRASSKQKRIAFRECVPATCRTSGAMTLPEGALVAAAANAGAQMIMSALVAEEVTPGDRWAAGMEEHKHGVEDGHGMQPLHGSGNQCTEQTKIVESTMKYQSDQLLAQPCQYRPTSVENCASNEHKRIAFIEPVVKRKLKKRKLRLRWTCDLCQVSNPSPRSLVVHCNGRVHQSMLENARKEPLRPIGGLSVTGGGGGPSWPSGENAAWPADQASMWTCRLCNSICGSASILQGHLGGKKHRANTNAILALFRSSYTTLKNDGDGPGKSEYYCKACDVHCKGDMMMAAHLVERMHRLDWREV